MSKPEDVAPGSADIAVVRAPYEAPILVELDIVTATESINSGPGPDTFSLADS